VEPGNEGNQRKILLFSFLVARFHLAMLFYRLRLLFQSEAEPPVCIPRFHLGTRDEGEIFMK
jgi:hypothetical protein